MIGKHKALNMKVKNLKSLPALSHCYNCYVYVWAIPTYRIYRLYGNSILHMLQGIEVDGTSARQEPLELILPSSVQLLSEEGTTPPTVAVTVTFHGHYNEPYVCLHCPVGRSKVYDLTYDLSNTQAGWSIAEREA